MVVMPCHTWHDAKLAPDRRPCCHSANAEEGPWLCVVGFPRVCLFVGTGTCVAMAGSGQWFKSSALDPAGITTGTSIVEVQVANLCVVEKLFDL